MRHKMAHIYKLCGILKTQIDIDRMIRILTLLTLPVFVFGQKNYSDLTEKYMQSQVGVNDFSGTVLIMKNDQAILKKAYGLADREWNINNTIDTKYRIGSITKQFTAASILLLEEKGKLSLNDRLSKYFPSFPKGDSITLHLLLCHRSGIGDYSEDSRPNTLDKYKYSVDFMISYIEKLPFDFSPNSNYNYSNSNYYLLGSIIEKVSGISFSDFVKQNILVPLDMKNTSVETHEEIVINRAKGYQRTQHGYINEEYYAMEFLYSAGGMYSTIEDMLKWDAAMKNGILLSKESRAKMFTSYTVDNTHYGYGAVIDIFQDHARIWHSGGGWAFNSNISRYPNDNICIVVMSNNQCNSENISNALSAILFDIDVQVPYIHKEYKINPKDIEKYTGKWIGETNSVKSEMELYTKDNKLYRKTPNTSDLELIPESETKFYYSDGSDRQIEFVLSKKGQIEYAWFIKDGIKYPRQRTKNK
jgi:CubicO group peptidase (beta-lactamase class C family)